MSDIPMVEMRDGRAIPQVGFGCYKLEPERTREVVRQAIEAGYRHIDTAALYDNETEVGQAIKDAGVPRDQLFVTTKVWNDRHDDVAASMSESLEKLGLDHVDLFLIHWPAPANARYVTAWESLIDLRAAGLATSIGVSNFNEPHLRRIVDATGVVPVVNQIEFHPTLNQLHVQRANEALGALTEAWSPIGRGRDLTLPAVVRIAGETGRTPAQVILRWHIQHGRVVIPKTTSPARLAENIDLFGFELDAAQIEALDSLNTGERIGPDPEEKN